MKIKGIMALAAVLALSLSSCGESGTSPVTSAETTAAAAPEPADTETAAEFTDKITETAAASLSCTSGSGHDTVPPSPVSEKETGIDLSLYGSNARFYPSDDIYVKWIDVGYAGKMPDLLMISDRKQLDYAKIRYPLSIPDDADEDTRFHSDDPLTEPFEEMTEKYPVGEYTYLLEYVRASGGGYHIIPAGIVISDDRIAFIASPDSKYPEWGDTVPDVCSDYCYMAAVPKGYLSSGTYPGWEQPDEDNMYRDADYRISAYFTDTDDVYDIYGDTNYIIRTRDEYDDFLAMSSQLLTVRGGRVISVGDPDLEKAAVIVCFFKSADCNGAQAADAGERKVIVDGNTITVQYPLGWDERSGTYMIYAYIPKRFLTEQSYDGWQAPPHTEPARAGIPDIDRSKYGKDAVILTAEDIVIYGSHTSCTDFSGRYVMRGEKGISAVWDDLEMYGDNNFEQFVEKNRFTPDNGKYPAGCENVIFVQYNNFDHYGSGLRPYALVIDGNKAEFLYTENKNADKTDKRPDSYCFFAAVPEELLDSIDFDGWSVYDEAPAFGKDRVAEVGSGNIGEMYYKEPDNEDIVTDPETGIRYVKNQLLISAFTEADRNDIESIIGETGAEIVGYIELTNDYQIEFGRDMSVEDLQNIADLFESYPFIGSVTLNIVSDVDLG
ncbi:MAG: hypothetical protein IJT87_00900 [Ruminiclostridium sp.]|nr:hypothetical protein [Ruminiclostridium sp.]